MKAFEIRLNQKKLCTAGVEEQGVLTAMVDYVANGKRNELSLSVGGLITSTDEQVRWVQRRRVRTGDEIRVKVVEAESVDKPKVRYRRDPAADATAQKRYVREMAKKFGWSIKTR